MTKRIVVDPMTRIEGHLRIDCEVDDGKVTKAWSSGQMWRGIELILQGRDPRDAWVFTQRICGVCTTVHAIASVRAVENALDYTIPPNAQLIRNLMNGAQYVHDHVMHFYHLHALDWVDVVSALNADPKATSVLAQSISSYPKSSPGYFADMQKKLKDFVEATCQDVHEGEEMMLWTRGSNIWVKLADRPLVKVENASSIMRAVWGTWFSERPIQIPLRRALVDRIEVLGGPTD